MSHSNADAAHSWQQQEHTRRNSGNLSSIGPRLISYSTPIAYLDEAHYIIFICRERYSTTTADKHKNQIRIPSGYIAIYPRTVDYKTPTEMVQEAAREQRGELETISRSRNPERYLFRYHEGRANILRAAERYNIDPDALRMPSIQHEEGALFFDAATIRAQIKRSLENANL